MTVRPDRVFEPWSLLTVHCRSAGLAAEVNQLSLAVLRRPCLGIVAGQRVLRLRGRGETMGHSNEQRADLDRVAVGDSTACRYTQEASQRGYRLRSA
jgi:hypothetical protein